MVRSLVDLFLWSHQQLAKVMPAFPLPKAIILLSLDVAIGISLLCFCFYLLCYGSYGSYVRMLQCSLISPISYAQNYAHVAKRFVLRNNTIKLDCSIRVAIYTKVTVLLEYINFVLSIYTYFT